MTRYAERKAHVRTLIRNPDVTLLEASMHLYYWYRFERALSKKDKYTRMTEKYAYKLFHDGQVFEFRKKIKDL